MSHSPIEVTCWRPSARQATRRSVSVIFAPQRRQPVKADLPVLSDAGLVPLPLPGVQARVSPDGGTPPLIVGVAAAAGTVRGACACRDRARPGWRQCLNAGIGEEFPDRRPARPLAELPDVRLAH